MPSAVIFPSYFSPPPAQLNYPPEVHEYNDKFTQLLQTIKQRHDPTVTTIAQGVLEWKKKIGGDVMGRGVQAFLDRFYMSRSVSLNCSGYLPLLTICFSI
jgi:pyruvate dehydrogenase kinase 2/3/4